MAAGEAQRRGALRARVTLVRRRLNLEVALRAAVAPVWVAATAVVVWRLAVAWAVPLAGGLALIGALGATAWLARRRAWTDDEAAVIADRQAGAGGMLLTRLERPVGGWEFELNQQVKALVPPAIEVRRPLGLLFAAALFVAAGLLVPRPQRATRVPNAAAATRVEQLVEKAAAVAREEPAGEATAAELARLQEELAQGAFDAADWESADALDALLDRQAAEGAAELDRAEEAARALSEALGAEGATATSEVEELERALLELADGAAASGDEALEQALGARGPGSGENGQPGADGQAPAGGENGRPGATPQGPSVAGAKGAESSPGGAPGDARSPERSRSSDAASSADGQAKGPSPTRPTVEELRRALAERRERLVRGAAPPPGPRGASSLGGRPTPGAGNVAGRSAGAKGSGASHASRGVSQGSGADRGGESRELVFGAEAELDPERLRLQALPQGQGGEAEQLLGLRAANPRQGPGTARASVGTEAVGTRAAGYDEGTMRPRNRALVQRYFQSRTPVAPSP